MIKGIDVSYANGVPDWKRLKNDGIEFAVIRSSFGSDEPSQVDTQFYRNADGCVKNGIPFMTYHFAYFINKQKALEEADFALRLAKQYPQIKAIALDIEEDSVRYADLMGVKPDWTECAIAFLERVRQAGYTPVLYTNWNWMTNVFDYKRLEKYPLWLASPGAGWATVSKYSNLFMWQYSWTGRPDGSTGSTDMDYCIDPSVIIGAVASTGTSTGASSAANGGNTGGNASAVSSGAVGFKSGKRKKAPENELCQVNSSQKVDMTVRVTAPSGLNMRCGAGTGYNKLGAVPFGEKVKVSRRTSGGGYTWGLAEYRGITGWIALDYTETLP